MAFHPDITRKDDVTVALDAANAAIRIASKQLTGNAGTVEIPNADGTSTIMGAGAGDTGVAPWVGDTIAPGKPLGITAESHNGAIWVSWDGTLDGGIPADFDHVQFTAVDGSKTVDMGRLTAAGKVTAAELTAGDTVTITAIAYDDAHAADGSSAPNASVVSDPVTVVVQSAVDAAQVQKAQDDAQDALDKAGQASDTATIAKNTAEGASTDATNATQTANDAKDTAADASSVAQSALSTAQSAQQDTVTKWVPQYAQTTSPTIAPTTEWSKTPPDWVAGSYIWSRMIVAYGSGDYETTDAVVLTGNTGEQGVKGDPGADGRDGTSVTVKGRVSTAANLPSSASNGDGYITEDDGHLHVWGSTGFTDVGQFKGENGLNAYAHTAWANSADGKTEFSTTSGGIRAYMGQYNDNTVADSDDPTKYTWTKIKGSDGAQGVGVTSITKYWALGTEAPAQPAVATPPSPWVPAEPGYQRDQNLYTTTKFTYDSGAFVYTNVQFDSSYQYSAAAETAARDALQSATNANTTAQTAKSTADSATSTANTAKSTADSASSVATQANATAVSAAQSATSAKTAANLALANSQELVVNGGFETGDLTGWTASGVGVSSGFDQDYPHSGNYQAKFAAGASCSQSINGLMSGHIIRCSFWQRGYDGRTATMTISFNGGTEQTVGSITGVTPYTRAFKDFTVPANTTTATIKLTCDTDYIWFDDISVKDITEAQAAQKAADDAQATANTANTAAQNATSIANAAKAAAQGAQTTADGKNKIFSSATQPSSTGLVPGDLWFQLDSSSHVTGIQVWNGSEFVDYLIVANEILVAGSVGTTQIKNGAITTDLLTSNAVTATKIAAKAITADKISAGSIDGMTITGATLQTTNKRISVSDTGITAVDNSGTTTVNIPSDGSAPMLTGGFQTGSEGSRIKVSEENGVGSLQLLENTSEVGSLRIFHNENGYAYVQLGAGVDGLQVASQTEEPDPLQPSVQITSTYSTDIAAGGGANINGTWFANDLSRLPTNPRQVGSVGTIGFAGGVRYVYDGNGSWQEYDTRVVSTNLTDFFTPASGFAQYNNESQVYRSGGLWHLHVAVSGTITKGTYTLIGTVKEEYRPVTTSRSIAALGGGYTGGSWLDGIDDPLKGDNAPGRIHVGNKSAEDSPWAALDFVYPATQFHQ